MSARRRMAEKPTDGVSLSVFGTDAGRDREENGRSRLQPGQSPPRGIKAAHARTAEDQRSRKAGGETY